MLTKKHKLLLCIVAGLTYIVNAVFFTLMAPFYPSEAETKGATPAQVKHVHLKLIKTLSKFWKTCYTSC